MKSRHLILLGFIAVIAFNSCTDAPESDKAATTEAKTVTNGDGDSYSLDTTGSKVEWIGTKVTGLHQGEIAIKSGQLTVKDGNITGGNFVMDMPSLKVVGGNDASSDAKLQGHLLSADFFDVTKYPEATFAVTAVKPFSGTVTDSADPRQEGISKYKVSNPTHTISGNLTMKGVTKNIEFPARVNVTGNAIDALAKFNIDRKQWNLVYPGKPDDLIRDEVHLGIALKAVK